MHENDMQEVGVKITRTCIKMTCKRCGEAGHNKRTCTVQIQPPEAPQAQKRKERELQPLQQEKPKKEEFQSSLVLLSLETKFVRMKYELGI